MQTSSYTSSKVPDRPKVWSIRFESHHYPKNLDTPDAAHIDRVDIKLPRLGIRGLRVLRPAHRQPRPNSAAAQARGSLEVGGWRLHDYTAGHSAHPSRAIASRECAGTIQDENDEDPLLGGGGGPAARGASGGVAVAGARIRGRCALPEEFQLEPIRPPVIERVVDLAETGRGKGLARLGELRCVEKID